MRKQDRVFAVLMLIVSVMLASMAAKAQSDFEMSCRAKAKEIALQTYQGCVSEARTSRLQEIRDGYKNEMSEVKAKYDRMLKEFNGAPASSPSQPLPPSSDKPVKNTKGMKAAKTATAKHSTRQALRTAEKPVNGVARKLPAKQYDNGPALPVQTVDAEQMPVVTASPVSAAPVTDEVLPDSMEQSPGTEDTSGFM